MGVGVAVGVGVGVGVGVAVGVTVGAGDAVSLVVGVAATSPPHATRKARVASSTRNRCRRMMAQSTH